VGALGAPHPVFSKAVPLAERASRERLAEVGNLYFLAVERNDGKGVYPFTDDCNRIENGKRTTNRPSGEPQPFDIAALGPHWRVAPVDLDHRRGLQGREGSDSSGAGGGPGRAVRRELRLEHQGAGALRGAQGDPTNPPDGRPRGSRSHGGRASEDTPIISHEKSPLAITRAKGRWESVRGRSRSWSSARRLTGDG
jgi:hypothetical protein